MPSAELVVLCAEDGSAVGVMDKALVHTRQTPLHLAFSCYLFDRDDRLLVTRRARVKLTWPGVRTNSCCGHPGPHEEGADAVRRRLADELGVSGAQIDLVVPGFRYRAVMPDGIVENEICPIYRATVDVPGVVVPNPLEVDSAWWTPWSEFVGAVDDADRLSPWARLQVEALTALGPRPHQWAIASALDLPRAAVSTVSDK